MRQKKNAHTHTLTLIFTLFVRKHLLSTRFALILHTQCARSHLHYFCSFSERYELGVESALRHKQLASQPANQTVWFRLYMFQCTSVCVFESPKVII